MRNVTKRGTNRMVELVERMLWLSKQFAGAKTGHQQTELQRQTDASDAQIDQLVYELYGLTSDEIKMVESTAKPHWAGHQPGG